MRTAICDAVLSGRDTEPLRMRFTIALNTARDQIHGAAIILANTTINLAGQIGHAVLTNPQLRGIGVNPAQLIDIALCRDGGSWPSAVRRVWHRGSSVIPDRDRPIYPRTSQSPYSARSPGRRSPMHDRRIRQPGTREGSHLLPSSGHTPGPLIQTLTQFRKHRNRTVDLRSIPDPSRPL